MRCIILTSTISQFLRYKKYRKISLFVTNVISLNLLGSWDFHGQATIRYCPWTIKVSVQLLLIDPNPNPNPNPYSYPNPNPNCFGANFKSDFGVNFS